jgi:MoaA/NifB/PqqE/SkfB family radical SAM enzyme
MVKGYFAMRIGSVFHKNQLTRWKQKFAAGFINRKQYNDWMAFYNSFAKNSIIDYIPPTISITISRACNLNCPTCQLLPFKHGKEHKPFMPLSLLIKIFDLFGDSFSSIIIAGGEPLTHPEFKEAITFLKGTERHVKLFTNGILLHRYIELLKGIHKINVSMDSFDEINFIRNRGGTPAQYASIIEGIKMLRGESIPFQMSFVIHRGNTGDALKFLDFAGKYNPESVKFHNINSYYSPKYQPLCLDNEVTQNFLNKVISRSDYDFDIIMPVILDSGSERADFQDAKCVQLWDGVRVGPDGSLALCCHNENSGKYGGIFDENLMNGEFFVRMREMHIEGRISGTICERCPQRFFAEDYAFFHAKSGEWKINECIY